MSRSFEDRGGRSPLIIKDLDLYPQPPTNTRSPTLNSEEPLYPCSRDTSHSGGGALDVTTHSQIIDVGTVGTLERQLSERPLDLTPDASHSDTENALTTL